MSPPGRPEGEYRSARHEAAPATGQRRPLSLARWASGLAAASLDYPAFMFDHDELPSRLSNVSVVLEGGGLDRVRARLAAGARQVLLAGVALQDAALMRTAIAEFGAARVGAWLPAQRVAVSWVLDTQSNGDFKCMAPSNPQASWEVLTGDLQSTGTEVGARIEQLVHAGLQTILISVDMQDDRDLDLCAGLMERFGAHLWFSPFTTVDADLASWIEFGQVNALVLPDNAAAGALADRLTARFGRPRAARELVA